MNIQGFAIGLRQILGLILLVLVVVFWAVGQGSAAGTQIDNKILLMFGITACALMAP